MLTYLIKKLTGCKFLVLPITICLLLNTNSKAQEIEWQKCLGGSDFDYAYSAFATNDSELIIVGYTGSNDGNVFGNHGGSDVWVIKISESDSIIWQKCFGGTGAEGGRSVLPTSDKGCIIGGTTFSNDGDVTGWHGSGDYWIIKLDSIGVLQWQKCLGGLSNDELCSISLSNDGGYYVAGTTTSNNGDVSGNHGNHDIWVIKIDSSGILQWQKCLGGSGEDYAYAMQTASDGSLIVVGSSTSVNGDVTGNHGFEDYWVVKLDSSGILLWQKCLGGSSFEEARAVLASNDGGYVITGTSGSIDGDISFSNGGGDMWMIKLDSIGLIQWEKSFGGVGNDIAYSITQTADDAYVLAGITYSNDGYYSSNHGNGDVLIVKVDKLGIQRWQNCIGGSGIDDIREIFSSIDSNVYMVGYSSSIDGNLINNNGSFDYWVLKLTDKYNLITGTTFLDLNSSSTQDIGEPSIPNKKITEANTNHFAFSQTNGFYSVSVLNTGNFTVTPSPMSYYTAVPVSHSVTFTSINQTDSLNDFAFQPLSTFNDLCVSLTPLGAFRPGFNASYMINYENVGTTSLSPTVTLYQSNLLSYVSSSVTPTITSTDSVQWSALPVLSPFQSGSILVTLNVSTSAFIGSNIYSQCVIEPIANDYNVYCNYSGVSSIITGSVDPNDILVNDDTLTISQLATQPFLDYTIRFQNTGNDTAFTVKIINPIDTNRLNLQTIELLNSSHPVNAKWIPYNKNMEFLFENILLPDSNINEPQSHGFVTYRIKPKTSLLAGDSITNKAYIYFDFNVPVETNTAITKIILPTSINELAKSNGQLGIFPNPTKDDLSLTLYSGEGITHCFIRIFDVLGNVVLSKQSTANCTLPTANLSKGIYFIEVKTGKQVYRGKFVKE